MSLKNVTFFVQVNPDMILQLEDAGLSFVGKDETGRRMEVRTLSFRSWKILPCNL